MPVIPGISTSVITRSQVCDLAHSSAIRGSGVWVTSKPPRLASTWVTNMAETGSSSTTRIRPGVAAVPLSITVLLWPGVPVRRARRRGHWQDHAERAAVAGRARHVDPAAVQVGERLDHGQPQP